MKLLYISLLVTIALSSCIGQKTETEAVAPEPQPLLSGVADSVYASAVSEQPENSRSGEVSDSDFVVLADVVPDIIQEIRYYATYNFVGRRIPGYEAPVALLTRRAADSLAQVSRDVVAQGYRLKVFDAYRPQRAVLYFVGWARNVSDTLMKPYFYPEIDKADCFRLGYLAHRSGHTRGSTIDLTLFDMATEREADMGGTYDFFGEVSHYWTRQPLSKEQLRHRRILREAMIRHGFKPIATEWWHFTLADEPFPNTEFDFPVALIPENYSKGGK
ncbi:MAG: peptidase M15 [Bacteroidales bacterium]|jgi:D-alanyl-D-alanine dipeptidase|nr:peptidase M15 [Bacteroidales bacterium]